MILRPAVLKDLFRLGAFVVGFLTLPEAVLQMPGANFWAFVLFFTLIVLGFSSAFVMLDVVVTLICDSGLTKLSRPWVVTILTFISFLMCIPVGLQNRVLSASLIRILVLYRVWILPSRWS
jgi:SNF family Na+-dependent transporter